MEENNVLSNNGNVNLNNAQDAHVLGASGGAQGALENTQGASGDVQGAPEKKARKMNAGALVGIGVAVVVLVAVIIAAIMMNGQGESNTVGEETNTVVDDDEEESVVLENTELSSGTVSTTIGGKTVTYAGAYVVDGIEATIGSGTYESVSDDEVVFLVINGGTLTIDGDVEIIKTGSADFQGRGDSYSFYGTNSAIVVVGEGSSASINGVSITTNVSGANAVVATNGGEVEITNSSIATSKDNSRGLHATYEGTITADSVEIATEGGSCASLATDRGAGTVIASNMTLSTAGAGSPLIYSTGSITVSDSTGTATGAQIAVVEGKNSITLSNCDFSANGIGNRNEVDNAAVMIYQSMSGDASVGKGSFTATDCTLTVLPSSSVYTTTPFFFVTNTEAEIMLTGVTANFYEEGYFVLAAGTEEWGKSGSNGATVNIDASNLTATSTNIGVDSISSVSGI